MSACTGPGATHYAACPCREAEFAKLQAEYDVLLAEAERNRRAVEVAHAMLEAARPLVLNALLIQDATKETP